MEKRIKRQIVTTQIMNDKIESRKKDFIIAMNLNDKLIWNQNIFRSFKKFPNSRTPGIEKNYGIFFKNIPIIL